MPKFSSPVILDFECNIETGQTHFTDILHVVCDTLSNFRETSRLYKECSSIANIVKDKTKELSSLQSHPKSTSVLSYQWSDLVQQTLRQTTISDGRQ